MTADTFRDRHPAPWTVEATPSGVRIVDANGMALAYVYAADDDRSTSIGKLTPAEARTLAAMIARLPGMVEREGGCQKT